MKTGTLYIVASPIGNMEDITLRAIKILKGSGLILSEDTRVTKKLLSRHNISSPVVSCHKFNEKSRARHLTKTLASGRDVSLVSDAGTPLLSDPGFFIVSECIREGIKVSPVPGPSSVTAAAVVSGFDPAKFVFRGFLPRKKKELREELEAAEKSSVPVIFFEAPSRVLKTLEAAAGIFAKTREVAVIKELTKIHEEVYRGGPEFLTEKLKGGRPRGEFIIVVSGRKEKKEEPADEEIKAELGALIKKGEKKSRAARRVAEKMGINKNRVYDISLGKKGHGSKKKLKEV